MTKRKKTEKITKAALTVDGKVMIVGARASQKARGKTDWKKLASMPDSEIDYADSPELGDKFWATAKLAMPKTKDRITMRVDHDVLGWLKQQGTGYQTKINAILRQYMKAQTTQHPISHRD